MFPLLLHKNAIWSKMVHGSKSDEWNLFYTIVNSDLLFTFIAVLSLKYLSLPRSFSHLSAFNFYKLIFQNDSIF